MQPKSITRFDVFYLVSLAAYTIGFFLSYDDTLALAREQYAAAGSDMNPSPLITGFFVFWMALGLLLWWLISNKASNGAKWTLVVLFVLLELIATIYSVVAGALPPPSVGMGLSLLSIALKGVAIFYLFRPDAIAWLERDKADR
jgi:hypothetical protein